MAFTPNLNLPLLDSSADVSEDHEKINQFVEALDARLGEVATQLAATALATHAHELAGVNGLVEALQGKADTTHKHALNDLSDVNVLDAPEGKVLGRLAGGVWGLVEKGVSLTELTSQLSEKADVDTAASLIEANTFTETQSAPSWKSTLGGDLNKKPKDYPVGVSHQQTQNEAAGGPENYGTCLTVKENGARVFQLFCSKGGVLYVRAADLADSWSRDWVQVPNTLTANIFSNTQKIQHAGGGGNNVVQGTLLKLKSFTPGIQFTDASTPEQHMYLSQTSRDLNVYYADVDNPEEDDLKHVCRLRATAGQMWLKGISEDTFKEVVHEGNLAEKAAAAGIGPKVFYSASASASANKTVMAEHGLGGTPNIFCAYLVCKAAQWGYAPGDMLILSAKEIGHGARNSTTWANKTHVGIQIGEEIYMMKKSAVGYFNARNSTSWAIKLMALKYD